MMAADVAGRVVDAGVRIGSHFIPGGGMVVGIGMWSISYMCNVRWPHLIPGGGLVVGIGMWNIAYMHNVCVDALHPGWKPGGGH
jgi:hypothetical protein